MKDLTKTIVNISRGISNIDINRIFGSLNKDDMNVNFVGVSPSDKIYKFVNFDRMITGKKDPFLISNTDRSDKKGTHWWSIFDIEPKMSFFCLIRLGLNV